MRWVKKLKASCFSLRADDSFSRVIHSLHAISAAKFLPTTRRFETFTTTPPATTPLKERSPLIRKPSSACRCSSYFTSLQRDFYFSTTSIVRAVCNRHHHRRRFHHSAKRLPRNVIENRVDFPHRAAPILDSNSSQFLIIVKRCRYNDS